MNVVFINHSEKQCGVYQYGKRMADILKTTKSTYDWISNQIKIT
jgi:hypothetical protein